MKVVLDANVFISFLFSSNSTITYIYKEWINGTFTVLVSKEIIEEIQLVLDRFVDKKMVPLAIRGKLLNLIDEKCIYVDVKKRIMISTDPKDDRYFSCAVEGNADYIVSGDKKHVLSFKMVEDIEIVSPSIFTYRLQK